MKRHAVKTETSWLLKQFEKLQGVTVLIHQGKIYSYDQLYSEICNSQTLLASKQVLPGQTVALLSDCSFSALAMFFAMFQNKNMIVPLVSNNQSEVDEKLKTVMPEHIITFENDHPNIETQANHSDGKPEIIRKLINAEKAGLILFSSGSTGTPKAMLHDLDRMVNTYQDKVPKQINILLFLLFDHIGGIDTLLRALAIGATITVPEQREPSYIASLIAQYKVNTLPASPTFLNLLLLSNAHLDFDLSSLQIIGYGAEPMPETLLKRLRETLPHVDLQQKFGTSETNAIRIVSKEPDSLFFKIADKNAEYRIVDGELWLKTQSQILGYLNVESDRFSDDNWFKTGDLVETADDGYFKFIGRVNDVINVGGEKVFPAEVECLLMELPEIKACLVYGEMNAITGNIVVAELELLDSSNSSDIRKRVRSFCLERLEPYKAPSKIKVVDTIAHTDRYKKIRRKSS